MVTVCKKWRLSYSEARRLVETNNNGNEHDAYFPGYSAIGPASNLYEVCDENNPPIYQDYGVTEEVSKKQCLDPLSNDQLHSYWQSTYSDIEQSLREQVSAEVNKFYSSIQQVITEQFNSSTTQCAAVIGEQHVNLDTDATDHNGENSLLSASQGGESCSESYSTYVTCHDNNSNCDTEESTNQLMYYSQESVENQIDQTLVRLQTYTLFISNVLRRSEYSTGSSS